MENGSKEAKLISLVSQMFSSLSVSPSISLLNYKSFCIGAFPATSDGRYCLPANP